jgi:capsular polysaccharide biosynthesis protein
VNPRSYLAAVGRHWILLLTTVLVGLATGVGVYVSTPKSYEATAQVLFSAQVNTTGQDLAYAGSYVQSRMTTYRRLGESPSVLRLAARSLKTGLSVKQLRQRTFVEVVGNTSIVKVYATDRSMARAATMADTVAGAIRLAVERLENSQRPTKAGRPVAISGVLIGTGRGDTSVAAPKLPLFVSVGAVSGLLVGFAAASLREVLRRPTNGEVGGLNAPARRRSKHQSE